MENIKLIQGDCLIAMKDIDDKSIDLILCDLPYGVLNKTNKNAKWDNIIPFDEIWKQYNRIIKDNGAIVLFGQGMFTAQLMISNQKMWRYNLIWNKILKNGFLNANAMPLRQHEDILVFYKNKPIYNPQFSKGNPLHGRGTSYLNKENTNNNYGNFTALEDKRRGAVDKYPTSILSFDKPHPSTTVHPTQKPVDLLEYLIKTYTNKNMLVLDCCMGSGSTGVACVNTNRKFIGIELDKKYYDIACERIKDAQNEKQSKLF